MSPRISWCVKAIVVLLLLLDQHSIHIYGWRPFVVHVDELITVSYSPKCRVNSSLSYPGLMNMNLDVSETVKTAYGSVEIFLQSDDGKYDLEIINRTVDLCRLFRDVTYEPILQVGLRLSKSNSNYLTGCSIKKGSYTLKNLKLNVEKLPPFFPEKNGYFSQTYLLDKVRRFFKVKLFFSVNKVYKKND